MESFANIFFMFFITFTNIKLCLSDYDNIQDNCPAISPKMQTIFINGLPCKSSANITAQDFRTSELSNPGSTDIFGAAIKIVTAAEFPGLNTLGLAIGRIDIDEDGLVNFHYHPRATEIIFVTKGVLLAGFIDTKNQVFQEFLSVGDVFVFPKGLFHFILNHGFQDATFVSVFNSQNPGLVSITATTFGNTLESLEKVKKKLISLSAYEVHDNAILTMPRLESIFS
ncbi:hypothetical protein TanjilG_32342 [Lupinus angustifolius]|uniref:Germin-like protein n=1 Tax=Lupinus angustifolius TaxID=3871 RepID=A0A4P1R0F6_LUPAN|nr:PREDICTED: germin-like protein subfamily 3 member 4 [Lupinus angustifolius]OIV99083.1 hypothetical protein TanjilG_32342 [Lupinus angustifolius]